LITDSDFSPFLFNGRLRAAFAMDLQISRAMRDFHMITNNFPHSQRRKLAPTPPLMDHWQCLGKSEEEEGAITKPWSMNNGQIMLRAQLLRI